MLNLFVRAKVNYTVGFSTFYRFVAEIVTAWFRVIFIGVKDYHLPYHIHYFWCLSFLHFDECEEFFTRVLNLSRLCCIRRYLPLSIVSCKVSGLVSILQIYLFFLLTPKETKETNINHSANIFKSFYRKYYIAIIFHNLIIFINCLTNWYIYCSL